jgi:maltokinase
MIVADALEPVLPEYLPRQRWFGFKDRVIEGVEIAHLDVLHEGFPGLVQVLVDVRLDDGNVVHYQLMVGLRPDGTPAEFLHGHAEAVLGSVETKDGPGYAYDALLDSELAIALLAVVAPDESVVHARPVAVEQSNTSIVFDDRLILKVFRLLAEGPNPEVEITNALSREGFPSIARPLATWSRDGRDLVFVQEYLAGGSEGWALALTSLRDLLERPGDPAEAGGDFAGEARRLGETTGALHVALARAFGRDQSDAIAWAETIESELAAADLGELDLATLAAVVAGLRELPDAGAAIRVHGDLHLGQTMRTDTGWYILDFEGEPARALERRRQPSSPLKDVAGMLRSFHYAAAVALRERGAEEEDRSAVARAWELRNRESFLDGYTTSVDPSLLPLDAEATAVVVAAFELQKAVYELRYEQGNRPGWVDIPTEALVRLARTDASA